jgi:hypothetical protein
VIAVVAALARRAAALAANKSYVRPVCTHALTGKSVLTYGRCIHVLDLLPSTHHILSDNRTRQDIRTRWQGGERKAEHGDDIK